MTRTINYRVDELVHFLRNCPIELQQPSVYAEATTGVHTRAVAMDVLRTFNTGEAALTAVPDEEAFKAYTEDHRLALQLSCWLLHHQTFSAEPDMKDALLIFWFDTLAQLSQHIKRDAWLRDEDRAEEMVRLLLTLCDLRPLNETPAESEDRLDAINTLKRLNVLQNSDAAYKRVQEIRRKMAEKRAREAANVYGRE